MNLPTLGVTDFAKGFASRQKGNSYSRLEWDTVVRLTLDNWQHSKPGDGEKDTSRKALIRVPSHGFYCPVRAKIVMGMPVQAEICQRQKHEDPFVERFVLYEDAVAHDALIDQPARIVDIVCFSRAALSEDGEQPSTDCDWEIVTILASPEDKQAPMAPLVMARNFLRKPGGTFTDYTANAFAESIWHHSTQNTLKVRAPK